MVAAFRDVRVLSGFALNLYCFGWEDCVCSPVPGDVLTVSTPAKPGDERLTFQTKANLAAEATSIVLYHLSPFMCANSGRLFVRPNVRGNLPAEAGAVSPGCDDAPCAAGLQCMPWRVSLSEGFDRSARLPEV
jgi:hypothetical protein